MKAENSEKRITFIYDAFGRRVSKTVVDLSDNSTEATEYVYFGDEVIEEYTSGSLTKSYILGASIDQPIAQINKASEQQSNDAIYYFHSNAQQSIMALTDENGAIAESYSYDAYGTRSVTLMAGQTPLQEYSYTGRRLDMETGLMYFRARYYSPELGRFISRDPLAFVDGMNLYAGYFAMFGSIDPMGLQQCGLHPTRPIDTMSGKELDFDEGLADRNQQARDGQQQNRDAFVDATLGTAGLIAESTIPGVGEVMDAAVLADPNAGWGAKTIAGISLGLNYFTAGILPNAGPFLRRAGNAADAIGDTARKVDKAKDYSNLTKQVASKAQLAEKGKIIAGEGSKKVFRNADRVAKQYGGEASDWVKKSSSNYKANDGTLFETHWVENLVTGERVEQKSKILKQCTD